MSRSPQPSTRRPIAMPDDLWREVEAYQGREAIATTAEAVRRLLLAGLRAEAKRVKK